MIQSVWQAAQAGPLVEAELLPLSQQGRLRVTYNWLYSALNCNPNDNSPFVWVLHKLDDQHLALSPKVGYAGRTLYASVRDDWDYFVQTQAPHSADWITAVGRDEVLAFSLNGFLVQLRGFNGRYLSVNNNLDTHVDSNNQTHQGYRVMSTAAAPGPASQWFLRPLTVLQSGLVLPQLPTAAALRSALVAAGVASAEAVAAHLLA